MPKKPSVIQMESSRRSFIRKGILGAASAWISSDILLAGIDSLDSPLTSFDRGWKQIRSQFILKKGVTYMNNASLGMPPIPVVKAVQNGYEAISMEPLHGKHDLQESIREKVISGIADTFGANPDEIVLTRNASEALHLQATSLDLKKGDEVIITTQEHPAGLRPWMYRQKRDGIRVKPIFIPSPLTSESDVLNRFESVITKRTKAISFCHVTRGGHLYPVKKLSALAKEKGITVLVDGAQAIGQFPLHLHDLGCDAYAVSLHKWVLAPAGTGFLFLRKESRDQFQSPFEPNPFEDHPGFDPPGTKDFPVRAAIDAALQFMNQLGWDQIEARCRYLSDHLKDGLRLIDNVQILSGRHHQLSAPGSTIFEKKGLDAIKAVSLMEKRIQTHIDEHQRDGHNAIRISTHIYNSTAEIDRLLDAL